MEIILLKLYVTGHTSRSITAISNLKEICGNEISQPYRLDIIDILEHPDVAEQEHILATPTLIKSMPPPMRRLIGDLSDRKEVLRGLDVTHKKSMK